MKKEVYLADSFGGWKSEVRRLHVFSLWRVLPELHHTMRDGIKVECLWDRESSGDTKSEDPRDQACSYYNDHSCGNSLVSHEYINLFWRWCPPTHGLITSHKVLLLKSFTTSQHCHTGDQATITWPFGGHIQTILNSGKWVVCPSQQWL
jgi:hypothetical protein